MDDQLAEIVDTAPRTAWRATLWRMHSVDYDALSGGGAARNGGRFNLKGTSTVYLASPRGTAVIEVVAGLALANVPVRPDKYAVQAVRGEFDDCIDLREHATIAHLGLTVDQVAETAVPLLARIGSAAAYLGVEAVIFPSSKSDGINVAAYVDNCFACLAPVGAPTPLPTIIDEGEVIVP